MKRKYLAKPVAIVILIGIFVLAVIVIIRSKSTDNKEFQVTISLPEPAKKSSLSLEEALWERKSVRRFRDKPLKLSDISQLLWAGQGITRDGFYRTAPSAGALYPIELYLLAGRVDGLREGIYRYYPRKHILTGVRDGDHRKDLCAAALGQDPIRDAAAVIVIGAVYARTTGKYRERGVRYVHIEVGHVAQNIALQAVSLDVGTVVIGAFHDDEVKRVVGMKSEEPLYIMPLGVR